MATPSLPLNYSFGKLSKPSVELLGKHEYRSYPCGTVKRKLSDGDFQGSCDSIDTIDTIDSISPQYSYKKPKLSSSNPSPLIPSPPAADDFAPQPFQGLRSISVSGSPRSLPKLLLVLHNPSQPVRTLITLHKYFLKALSIHYAHNGSSAPAELGRLLETITGLWKERSVTQRDIQKMLAIYELRPNIQTRVGEEIAHCLSPFKLFKAGLCVGVEYAGKRRSCKGPMSTPFDEKSLQDSYKSHVYALNAVWTRSRHVNFSLFSEDSLDNFPTLACDIGTQTAACKAHISQTRSEILTLSNAAQIRNMKATTSMTDMSMEGASSAVAVLDNRKQSLLDRIKAKQLAGKAMSKPTPCQILREHALGRVGEVTEILRMMYQQHRPESKSKIHDHTLSEFDLGNAPRRVSFSLAQIWNYSKSSVRVPISVEEVLMCLKMLSEELDGTWVRMIESKGMAKAVFVILEGGGISGQEVQRRLITKKV